jgi:DNA-binding CsgD family transcriptional regulator
LALLAPAIEMVTRKTPTEEPGLSLCVLADIVRLAMTVGDASSARAATEAAVGLAGRVDGVLPTAVADHCRGAAESEPARLLAAARSYRDIRHRLCQGHALENAAVLLGRRGASSAARRVGADAYAIYSALNAIWDIQRAAVRLRPLGVWPITRTGRRRPPTGWEALTPAELTVAGLVAGGRSNPDIAAALFLSRRTVQTHVSHILAKLGAHSRVDIARAVISQQHARIG